MSFILGGLSSDAKPRQYDDAVLVGQLWGYLRAHHWKLAVVVMALFVGSLSTILVPVALGQTIDRFAKSNDLALWLVFAALIGFALLTWGTQYVQQRLTTDAVADIALAAQRETLRSALRQDHAFYDRHSSGTVVSRITTDSSALASVVQLSVEVLNQIILVVLLGAALILINPTMALVCMAVMPIAVVVALVFRRLARQAARQAQQSMSEINAGIGETMRGITVAKNYRQEAVLLEEFRKLNVRVYNVSLANNRIFGAIYPLLDIIGGISTALVLYLGGRMVLEGGLSAGSWYLSLQTAGLFLFPLTGIASFWSQFQQGLAATERVRALVESTPNVQQQASNTASIADARVRFEAINFSYDGEQPVLQDFNLDVPSGQRIALIGRTGSGKTSLLRILMRFYEYQSGRVTLGGVDLRQIPFEQLGNLVGLVSQTPILLDGTIAANIRFARPEASDAEVERAARSVGQAWLDDLPKGLETAVGERGALLSQGQRQLVTLARVMLQRPKILLLDEATANVDSFSESQLEEGLNAVMAGRTTIVVAHRLSTVVRADRVVILENGHLVADGTHRSLLQDNPYYTSLSASYFREASTNPNATTV